MLSLIERSKKVLDVKCWSGAIVEDISGFLKNTNKDILMTKLNVVKYHGVLIYKLALPVLLFQGV